MDTSGTHTLFELLPIGAYRSSIDGRQLRANAALVRLNGYDSEREMLDAVNDIAREWYVEPQRRAEFQQLMQRDGLVTDFVSEIYRHKSRERIWIRENAHLVRAADGTPLHYEGTVEDITRQYRTEQALQASERRFRAFIEASQVLTVLCDADGLIRYASPSSQRLLGQPPQAMLHTRVTDWVHPQDVLLAVQELREVADSGSRGEETVLRVAHADGGWRHLAVLANNCLDDPAIAGLVLNARDVSGRTRAEAALRELNAELEQRVHQRTLELQQARDEAESASRAKSEFLSRMSHELRTPMHAILGFGQVLQRDASPAWTVAARAQLQQILQAGGQLLGLIDALLDLARIEVGELPLQLEAVPLRPLLEDALQAVAPLAAERGVLLPPLQALPSTGSVRADRERLRQVLRHLLAAAVEAQRRGGSLRLQADEAEGRWQLRLEAAGLAEREPLDQPPAAPPAEEPGIGLALCRRLAGLMHGEVGVDTMPGGGSVHWLQLQAARDDEPQAQGPAATGTVLYIEDNPVNVLLMEAMLAQQTQLHLLSAELPEDGLKMAAAHRPDLILLDIQLPGIDGFEVLRRLRAADETRAIPVIALSANAMRSDLERGQAAGFDEYLTKPIDQRLLMAALARLLPNP